VIEDVIAEDDGLAQHGAGRIPGIDVGLERVDEGVLLRLSLGGDRQQSDGEE